MTVQQEKHQEPQKTNQNFWKSTRKTLHAASFGAQKYKRLVQKKMDLATNNRKFPALYSELGKLIDDIYSSGEKDIFARGEIHDLLGKLQVLKEAATSLESEIEKIKHESPEEEVQPISEKTEKTG